MDNYNATITQGQSATTKSHSFNSAAAAAVNSAAAGESSAATFVLPESECSSSAIYSNAMQQLKKPAQDSEDSSYDSDCEVSDGTTHYDVSRTVSDTLGQEFAEYVTLGQNSTQSALLDSALTTNEQNVFTTVINDPEYSSRLDFAKKLGYSESQVKIALSKLGPSPPQNELLNELILLDSSSSCITSEYENIAGAIGTNLLSPSSGSSSLNILKPSILRHIVIDGSNVAMSHGNNKIFSCLGIQLTVDYFKSRGHRDITVFVPLYRKEMPKLDDPVSDQHILHSLEKDGILVYTPSRNLNNRRLICYDDRYVLKLAVDVDGIVVSNDNYRDLTIESADFKRIIEERILMYSFVNDRFMPPEDPLGRNGPTLDQFLSKSPIPSAPPCPYGRKCTYGQKCKYYHVTQQKSVSETLRKQAAMKTQSVPITMSSPGHTTASNLLPISRTKSALVPIESGTSVNAGANPHRKLQRQLSINPGGDPRISQSFGAAAANSSIGSVYTTGCMTYLNPFPGNPTLSKVWSPPGVTTGKLSSPSPLEIPSPTYPSSTSTMDSRTRMYYHLSAIFPEQQVRHVMSLYPNEADAGFICRAIVNIFK